MTRTASTKPDYILGVDIGTSSSKALAFSLEGRVIAQSQAGYDTEHPRPSYAEQDADQIFEAVVTVIRKAVRQAGRQPLCVSFSAAMHSLMAVDGKGRAASPLLIWSDARSGQDAGALRKQRRAGELYRHTGTPIHPMSPLCKLHWWVREDPDGFRRAARFVSIKEYVFARLFGEYLADYSLASATGLFDHKALRWYAPALAAAGIKASRLSEPVSPLHRLQGLSGEDARRMGLTRDVPFIIGGSDGCLANLGTGVTRRGELAVTIGTSGAVRLYNDRPVHDKGQGLFNYLLLEKEYICGGAINNGGVLLDWFRGDFMREADGEESYEDFLEEAFRADPGSNGLLFLPYLQGERAPMWDDRARGAFVGISLTQERKHFMRAMLEGICFSLYDITHLIEAQDIPIREVFVSGGFTRSPEWVQLLTDVFGKKVTISASADASCVGAALMGMRALGLIRSWNEGEQYIPITGKLKPNRQRAKVYGRNYALFSTLYAALKPAFHDIAGWQTAG